MTKKEDNVTFRKVLVTFPNILLPADSAKPNTGATIFHISPQPRHQKA